MWQTVTMRRQILLKKRLKPAGLWLTSTVNERELCTQPLPRGIYMLEMYC